MLPSVAAPASGTPPEAEYEDYPTEFEDAEFGDAESPEPTAEDNNPYENKPRRAAGATAPRCQRSVGLQRRRQYVPHLRAHRLRGGLLCTVYDEAQVWRE